ncbi:hypothetical protein tb265_49110 [Gemmatimonadetes bacterium T265]|nr:hypothetical protein tb265_49110 [Gemmatimonadetes bacterium T265]
MLPTRYLRGLAATPFDGAPGVFAVPHARRPGSYRYLCSYRDGQREKPRIFTLLARYGQPEPPAEWDLHHVVEGQHFADVDFRGALLTLYTDVLPCVLIHQAEHRAYNRLLHARETDVLFRDALPRDVAERSRATAAAWRDPKRRGELRTRVGALAALYRDAYDGDPVLQHVAQNVLDEALAQLP